MITTTAAAGCCLEGFSRYSGFCTHEQTNGLGFELIQLFFRCNLAVPSATLPENTSTLPRIHNQTRHALPSRTDSHLPRASSDSPGDNPHSGFTNTTLGRYLQTHSFVPRTRIHFRTSSTAGISMSMPHPASESHRNPQWTLPPFLQPRTRLECDKKCHSRLLKSTEPGRPDHILLWSATEKLDRLFHWVET